MYKHEPDGRDYFVYRELTKVGKSLNNRQWYTGSMQGSPHRNSFGSPQRPRTASPQPEKLRNRLMMQQGQVHNQQMRPMGPDRLQEIEENLHALDMEDWRSDRLLTEQALHPKDRLHDTQESKFSSLSDFSLGTQLKYGDSYAVTRAQETKYDHLRMSSEFSFPPQHRDVHNREVHNREVHNREVHNRDMHNREVHNRDVHSRDVHNRDVHSRDVHNRAPNGREPPADASRGNRFENWKSTGDYRLDFESLINRSLSPPRQRHDRLPAKTSNYEDPDRLGHASRYPLVLTPRGRLTNNPSRLLGERLFGERDYPPASMPARSSNMSILNGKLGSASLADSDFDISASPQVMSRFKPDYRHQSPTRTSFRPGVLQQAPSPQLSLNLAAVEEAGRQPQRRLSREWDRDIEDRPPPPRSNSSHTYSPPKLIHPGVELQVAAPRQPQPSVKQSVGGSPPQEHSGAGNASWPSVLSESRTELAQQLLDQMLGQYFSKARSFQTLMATARAVEEAGELGPRVAWLEWWLQLEKEVRGAIKPEMKAVYDTRCRELFMRSKLHLRALFDRHGEGEERALSIARVQQLADPDVWGLYTSHEEALEPGHSGRLSWQRFWEDSESILKAAVKDRTKQLVKQEMGVKFAQWRRRFHAVFHSVDIANRGIVEAAALAQALQASPLGLVLSLPPPEREGLV